MSGEETGFSAIPNWLLYDPSVKPFTKLMFGYLNGRAGERGITFPSQRTMAKELGVSVETVKRCIRELEAMELVVKQVERTPTGRRNRYRVLTDKLGRRWGG